MKAAVITEPGRLEIAEVPDPASGPYQALVRMLACGTCSATDLKIIDGKFGPTDYPVILGHESVGEVIEVGERVANLDVGDHVLRPCAVYRPATRVSSRSYPPRSTRPTRPCSSPSRRP